MAVFAFDLNTDVVKSTTNTNSHVPRPISEKLARAVLAVQAVDIEQSVLLFYFVPHQRRPIERQSKPVQDISAQNAILSFDE